MVVPMCGRVFWLIVNSIYFLPGDLLLGFVRQAEQLYGDVTIMSFNVHQLLHLADAAKDLGPLWAHSAFVFEAGNGRVLKHVKAGKGVPLQILERVVMQQQLQTVLLMLPLSEKTTSFCRSMLGYKRLASSVHSDGACLLGSGKPVRNFTVQEQTALHSISGCCPAAASEYFRFTLQGTVHNSLAYKKPEKSDSTVCITKNGEYMRIQRILRTIINGAPKCVLLCKEVVIEDEVAQLPPHIHQCFELPELRLQAIFMEDILQVCLFFSFQNDEKSYVCDLPNLIERD